MCKWSKWGDTRIDPCMRDFIRNLVQGCDGKYVLLASCCGHGKYPMTIVARDIRGQTFDLVSNVNIPRGVKFYKRDKQQHYYIPEVVDIIVKL